MEVMLMYAGLTTDICIQATCRTLPYASQLIREESKYANRDEQGCLVFLSPLRWEPKYKGPFCPRFLEDIVLYMHGIGDPDTWTHDYDVYALVKSFASWYTGLSGSVLNRHAPELMIPSWTKWAGAKVRRVREASTYQVAAFSGVEDYLDERIADAALGYQAELCRAEMDMLLASEDDFLAGPPTRHNRDAARRLLTRFNSTYSN